MKKISIILITGLSFLLFSCDSKLDLEPRDTVSAEFNSVEVFQLVLNGVYSSFTATAYFGELMIAMEAWAADDLKISPQNNGQGAFVHHWNYTSGDQDTEAIWGRIYTTIFRANLIINNFNDFQPANQQERDQMDQILSQAFGLRALAHFHAYQLFGQRYSGGSELAVPIVTSLGIEQKLPRSTTNELFTFMRNDLMEAISSADGSFAPKSFGQVAMRSLLAKIALYEENWSEVVTQVNNALDAGAPELASQEVYTNMWNDMDIDGGENIFKINFEPTNARIGDIFYAPSLNAGYYWATDDLLSSYDQVNDIRFSAFFNLDAFPRVTKYIGSSSNPNIADAKVFRTSELYLMRAEANYRLGNDQQALDDLNAVRTARIENFMSPGESGEALFESIQLERRKELAFESNRFFDLRRWNQSVERIDCTSTSCLLPADNHRFVYPIPEAEMFANENMVQNPGY